MFDALQSNSDARVSPLRKKLDVIGSIFIRHDDIHRAWSVLDRTYHFGFRLNESSTGYIYGHSRCGKTETAHRFIQSLTGKRPERGVVYDSIGRIRGPVCQLIDGKGVKIVYLDLTNGTLPLAACKEILKVFKDVKPNQRMKQPEATARVIETLGLHQVDMLIVDESQQAFRGHGIYAPDALGEWLLPMENAKVFKIVLVGSPELKRLFKEVLAARARHGGLAYLKPFNFKTEEDKLFYGAFVRHFERDLPFDSTCLSENGDKVSERRLFDTYFATRGAPGDLSLLCEASTISAFERSGSEAPNSLILADFAAGFDYLYHYDERMKGVNPFATTDRKSIPTIPLSWEDEERESFEHAQTPPRRRRTKGGRIRG
jgi:AAA domain